MLDVHAPHKALHGTGEFFLHLFTITIGLLIAVGIEAAVTRHEHKKLAQEAYDSLTDEIRRNFENTADALRKIEAQQKTMANNLTVIAEVQKNPDSPAARNANIDASFGSTDFESTAWRTAQATGALAYMPYEEAKKFSGIYDEIQTEAKAQDAITDDEAQLLGVLRRYTSADGRIGRDQADAMAERFGIWQGHLLAVHISLKVLYEEESAFLEHREPQHHMSEKISG
jgi:hypothetical protein